MTWLHYLVEANIYLTVFYMLYYVVLTNDTHYRLRRIYLLSTCIMAYIIPVVQINLLQPKIGTQVVTVIPNASLVQGYAVSTVHYFNIDNAVISIYIAGVIITLGTLLYKMVLLCRLTRIQKSLIYDRYKLITLKNSNTAFSFFNYVFIGTQVTGVETIIRHELVHIQQKHSFDIVFLEVVKIINWFNPFLYLLQLSLKTVHEYIADEQTAAFEKRCYHLFFVFGK